MHNPFQWLYITDKMFETIVTYNIKLFVGGCIVLAILFVPSLFRKLPKKEYTSNIEKAMVKNKEKHKVDN